MRRVAFLLSLLAAGVFAASASATQPVITPFTATDVPGTLSGVCSFDVSISTDIRGTEIDYFDANGALTRSYVHVVEQDTFSANGKAITGEPFTFNIEVLLDADGNVTHLFASGVTERIVLPEGTFFLSAGRIDFSAHPGVGFLLSPDVGNPGNVAAFCAALS
jgi:hypothetical protein